MSDRRVWDTRVSDTKQRTLIQDTTVEEIRLFVRRLRMCYPAFCDDCKKLLKEYLD